MVEVPRQERRFEMLTDEQIIEQVAVKVMQWAVYIQNTAHWVGVVNEPSHDYRVRSCTPGYLKPCLAALKSVGVEVA